MLRYTTDRTRPGLVALYNIQPGNGAGQFLHPQSPHGAQTRMVTFGLWPMLHWEQRGLSQISQTSQMVTDLLINSTMWLHSKGKPTAVILQM